jgi:hypothetical protein
MKNSFLQIFSTLFSCILACASLPAHEETIIKLENSKLIGLPDKYQPAELDLKEYRFRIKNNVMNFAPIIEDIFMVHKPYDLTIGASWHPEGSIGTLPPYIWLRVQEQGSKISYSILFNLDTLDVMNIMVTIPDPDTVTRNLHVKLSDLDKKEIQQSISRVTKDKDSK